MLSLVLASGAALAGKNPNPKNRRLSRQETAPHLLNAGSDPTLRFPVGFLANWKIYSLSNGWLEVSRTRARYTVVQPEKKSEDGIDVPRSAISGAFFGTGGETYFLRIDVRSEKKKSFRVFFLPPDEWGKVSGAGCSGAARKGLDGSMSISHALYQFDSTVAGLVFAPVRNGDLGGLEELLQDSPDLALFRDATGMTPLHVASQFRQKEVAEWLIAHQAKVDAVTDTGRTPLSLVAKEGHTEMAELLLVHQADPNIKDKTGATPLQLAVISNHKDVVALLIAHHADVNTTDSRGETPLHLATNSKNAEIADLLTANGAQDSTPVTTVFQDAVGAGDLAKVQQLLKDHPEFTSNRNADGQTPLHLAAARRHKDVAELLLASGAEVGAKDNEGRTPLHNAAGIGTLELAQLLLSKGADINAKDNKGQTPLKIAATAGQIDMSFFLHDHGGQPWVFSGMRDMNSAQASSIDKIVLLPVVDGRDNTAAKIDLEAVRKSAQKDLEQKRYTVAQADTAPPEGRWVMLITLADFGRRGAVPVATVFGTLYDKQSGTVDWQSAGTGSYESADNLNQPTGNLNQALMQANAAQLTDLTFLTLLRGEAKKAAWENALGGLLRSLPTLPKK